MSEKPRVDSVSGDFYRRDKCVVCGKTAERSRTFTASTLKAVRIKGTAWGKRPLAHKKCEWKYIGEDPL